MIVCICVCVCVYTVNYVLGIKTLKYKTPANEPVIVKCGGRVGCPVSVVDISVAGWQLFLSAPSL